SQWRNSSTDALGAEARATSTRSTAGRLASSNRTASRKRRLIRFLVTGLPIFDDTVSPTRAPATAIPVEAGSRGRKLAASGPSAKLLPRCLIATKSARRSSRALFGNAKAAKGALPWLLPRRADDEPLATLRPAALEHPAARLGRVPLAKPVLAIAADLARLVRALHGDCLLRAKSAARK